MSHETSENDRIYYLASPYTHADPAVMQSRHDAAVRAVMRLQELGHTVFSPIVHSVPVERITGNNDLDHWLEIDKKFIRKLDGLIVLFIDGMPESKGVRRELDFAAELGKPILVYDPWHDAVFQTGIHGKTVGQYEGT